MRSNEKHSRTPPETKARLSRGIGEILREYWRHMQGHRYLLALVLLGMVVDAALQSGVVAYLKIVIDSLVASPADFVSEKLPTFIMLGLGGALLFFPFAYTGHFAGKLLAAKLSMRLRASLYAHIQRLHADFYHRHPIGDISSRITADIDNGVNNLVMGIIHLSWSISILVFSMTAMAIIHFRLFLLTVTMSMSFTLISRWFLPKVRRLTKEVRDQLGLLSARVTEDFSSFTLMKSFALEGLFFDRFFAKQRDLYQSEVKAHQVSMLYMDITQMLFIFVAPVVLLGTSSYMVLKGSLTVGALVAFWSYWKVISGPVNQLFNIMTLVFNSLASMDRVMEFFSQHPEVKDRPDAKFIPLTRGDVRFENVDFSYRSFHAQKVLRTFNLEIPAHTSMGIVGPSGAGKSTLIQLLLRFYDPDAGRITIDGHDIRDMKQEDLRRQIGVVFQDTILLSGSIRQNLLLGKENASDQEIWDALEQAGAKDFVASLDRKLDSELGERGVNLSGGQRQRLSIARVFLKNPPVVIFDEATSALDSLTELHIQQSMHKLLEGRTSIVIAHRLSTVMNCHSILLLDQGKVLDLGSHSELMTRSELYGKLVKQQNLAA